MPLNNILLPIEHPLDAEWAIEWLAQKPFQSTPHLSLLHVIPFTQPVLPIGALLPDAWKKELQTGSAHFTQEVTNTLTKLGYQADRFVEPGAPLIDHSRTYRTPSATIGSHGYIQSPNT